MVAAGCGKIVNIGSIISVQGQEMAVDYAAAKGAVITGQNYVVDGGRSLAMMGSGIRR